jgi:hypothetical protein
MNKIIDYYFNKNIIVLIVEFSLTSILDFEISNDIIIINSDKKYSFCYKNINKFNNILIMNKDVDNSFYFLKFNGIILKQNFIKWLE